MPLVRTSLVSKGQKPAAGGNLARIGFIMAIFIRETVLEKRNEYKFFACGGLKT